MMFCLKKIVAVSIANGSLSLAPFKVEKITLGDHEFCTGVDIKLSAGDYQEIEIKDLTYKGVTETVRGSIYAPGSVSINPYVEWVENACLSWVKEVGFVTSEEEAEKFRAGRFGLLASVSYPTAEPADLLAHTKLIAWLFRHDDRVDKPKYETARDHLKLEQFNAEFTAILDAAPTKLDSTSPFIKGIADIHAYYYGKAQEFGSDYSHFVTSLKQYFQSTVSLVLRRENKETILSIEIYRKSRDFTSAVEAVIEAELLTKNTNLTRQNRDDVDVKAVFGEVNICVCNNNDFHSAKRELKADTGYNENVLLVILRRQEALKKPLSIQDALSEGIMDLNECRKSFEKTISKLGAYENTAINQLIFTGSNCDNARMFWHKRSGRYF